MKRIGIAAAAAAGASLLLPTAAIAAQRTAEDPMLVPVADGWSNVAISTVGETIGAYTPPGLLDGMGAYAARGRGVMSVFVNHELRPTAGYPYALANGTELTGARISRYDVQTNTLKVIDAELAYHTIYDVNGAVVTSAAQVGGGLGRFCSGRGVSVGEFGFVDAIHFAGEEQTNGVLYALDTATGELWAVPDAGRLGWENVSPVDTGDPDTVALLIGDDRVAAPLWLYVGDKVPGGTFLERNGLAGGMLYAWVADEAGVDSPAEFSGDGSTAAGSWVAIGARNGDGTLRTTAELDAAADAAGHFAFSRPEDVHENPEDGQQLVLASTGREGFDGNSDVYGTTYLVDLEFSDGRPTGTDLTILYDGDEASATTGADAILRSPDNLTWASDGKIYVQEDRAIDGDWGTIQASIWQLDPSTPGAANRIAVADQSAIPADQTLTGGSVGQWETSGVIDVTHLVKGGAPLALLYNVQAHGVGGGRIADLGLAEGGQLGLLTFAG